MTTGFAVTADRRYRHAAGRLAGDFAALADASTVPARIAITSPSAALLHPDAIAHYTGTVDGVVDDWGTGGPYVIEVYRYRRGYELMDTVDVDAGDGTFSFTATARDGELRLRLVNTGTIDIDALSLANDDPIPQTAGDRTGLAATSRTLDGFGDATPLADPLYAYGAGYGSLAGAAYASGGPVAVGEIRFIPTDGRRVAIDQVRIASFTGDGDQDYDVRVYSLDWEMLFQQADALPDGSTVTVTIPPDVASRSGLILQWFSTNNGEVGVNEIVTRLLSDADFEWQGASGNADLYDGLELRALEGEHVIGTQVASVADRWRLDYATGPRTIKLESRVVWLLDPVSGFYYTALRSPDEAVAHLHRSQDGLARLRTSPGNVRLVSRSNGLMSAVGA